MNGDIAIKPLITRVKQDRKQFFLFFKLINNTYKNKIAIIHVIIKKSLLKIDK